MSYPHEVESTERVFKTKPGALAVRYLKTVAASTSFIERIAYVEKQSWHDKQKIVSTIKAQISSVTTGDFDSMRDPVAGDLAAALRPATVLGKLTAARIVRPNTRAVSAASGTSGAFVSESAPIPISRMDLNGTELPMAKCAAALVVSSSLLEDSRPESETLLQTDLVAALVQAMDSQLLDPSKDGSDGCPASITNGISALSSSGSSLAQIDADLQLLIASLVAGGSNLVNAVWIISPITAAYLASLRGTGGDPAFPRVTVLGGELMGLPVIVSAGSQDYGSPILRQIVLLDQSRLVIADEGQATVTTSQNAAVQLLDNPTGGASQLISLWQAELIAIKAVRCINWALREAGSIAVLAGVNY